MTGAEIALGVMAVSAIAAAGAATMSTMASNAAAEQNASLAYENAQMAENAAAERARRIRREGARAVSAVYAGAGKSGLTIEGSPLDVAADNAANAELAALDAEYEGTTTARRLRIQGAQFNASKQDPWMAGGLTLLAGGAKVAGQYAGGRPDNPYGNGPSLNPDGTRA